MIDMRDSDDRRQQLDAWMNARRRELRIKWNEVARRANMTPSNLLRIRRGQINLSEDAIDGIEDALEWERGSVEAAVADGIQPAARDLRDAPRRSPVGGVTWTSEMEAFYQILKAKFHAEGLEMNEANVLSAIDQLRIELSRRVSKQDRIPNDSR